MAAAAPAAVRLPTQLVVPNIGSSAPAATPTPAPISSAAGGVGQQMTAVRSQAVAAAAPAAAGGMSQQMTPDTAKIKCKNFLSTLLRLASDQPEAVARNVRSLIQVRFIIMKASIYPSFRSSSDNNKCKVIIIVMILDRA